MIEISEIIEKNQDAIASGWAKIGSLTGKTDFIAVIEPSLQETSIIVLPRESGLALLSVKGCDITHPSMERLTEPATGLTKEAKAIWIVVLFENQAHIAKIVHQHMARGGSA